MIGEDGERMFSSLEPMAPLLKRGLHGEKFSIAHIVILLSGIKFAREKGAGIEFRWVTLTLGKNSPDACAGGVHLYNEFLFGVRMM